MVILFQASSILSNKWSIMKQLWIVRLAMVKDFANDAISCMPDCFYSLSSIAWNVMACQAPHSPTSYSAQHCLLPLLYVGGHCANQYCFLFHFLCVTHVHLVLLYLPCSAFGTGVTPAAPTANPLILVLPGLTSWMPRSIERIRLEGSFWFTGKTQNWWFVTIFATRHSPRRWS